MARSRIRAPRTWVFGVIVGVAVGLAPLPALAARVTVVRVIIEVVAVTGGFMLGVIIAGLRPDADPPANDGR